MQICINTRNIGNAFLCGGLKNDLVKVQLGIAQGGMVEGCETLNTKEGMDQCALGSRLVQGA